MPPGTERAWMYLESGMSPKGVRAKLGKAAEESFRLLLAIGAVDRSGAVRYEDPAGAQGALDLTVPEERKVIPLPGPTKKKPASGITTGELIGAFLRAWTDEGLGDYVVTGKDRAVFAEHIGDFSCKQEAYDAFRSRVAWARRDEFWKKQLCLRAALETIPNQMSLATQSSRVPERLPSGMVRAGDLVKEYVQIARERGFSLPGSSGASGSTPLSEAEVNGFSTSESTADSP